MKVSNGTVVLARAATAELLKIRLPGQVAAKLARMARALDGPASDIEVAKNAMVLRHAPEGARAVQPTDPNWFPFWEEYNAYMASEAEVDCDRKVVLPPRVDGKPFEVSGDILYALIDFVELDEGD